MKTYVLDTNSLLRFLLDDIPSQTKIVKEKIKLAKQGELKLIVHALVIFEVIYALTKVYGFPKEKVVNVLKKIIAFKYLDISEREIISDALEVYLIKNLSFVDCFLYKLSHKFNAELFTFDRNLEKLSKNV